MSKPIQPSTEQSQPQTIHGPSVTDILADLMSRGDIESLTQAVAMLAAEKGRLERHDAEIKEAARKGTRDQLMAIRYLDIHDIFNPDRVLALVDAGMSGLTVTFAKDGSIAISRQVRSLVAPQPTTASTPNHSVTVQPGTRATKGTGSRPGDRGTWSVEVSETRKVDDLIEIQRRQDKGVRSAAWHTYADSIEHTRKGTKASWWTA